MPHKTICLTITFGAYTLNMMMSQHFLLSADARTLSLAKVMRLTGEEDYDTFKAVRWTDGNAICAKCGSVEVYEYKARRIFKCKGCTAQFSVTSGTIFASRKMPVRDLLAAIAILVNGAKGHSAAQLSRDLDCQYKAAFVLAHKLREAIAAIRNERKLSGEVEVDGAYFGGYVKPRNHKRTATTIAAPNTKPASAASLSSCASATASRSGSCSTARRRASRRSKLTLKSARRSMPTKLLRGMR